MKNNLPKYWCVKNDGSQLFKDTVIKYLNNTYSSNWDGDIIVWYGHDGNYRYKGTNCHVNVSSFQNNPTILTINEFIDMTTEEWTPKRGELVEVKSYEGEDWCSNIYLTTIEGTYNPFICVYSGHDAEFKRGNKFNISSYRFMREITPTHKELTLQEIADKFGVDVKDLRIKEA